MTNLEFLETSGSLVAELTSDGVAIRSLQDAIDLIGNASFQGASHLIVRSHHLDTAFFDLRSGLAGEILQKFVNYRLGLVVVGDIDTTSSDSLRAFVAESNRGGQIAFVEDRAAALARIAGT